MNVLQELHAAHKARLERMTRYAQASCEPPPPRSAPEPELPKPLPEVGPMRRIVQAVSRASGIRVAEIVSKSRRPNVVTARHVFYWIVRTTTKKSNDEIGKFCGGRDHSSVWAALDKIERRLPEFQWLIDASKKVLDDMPKWEGVE